jgi:16S rRNA (cytosine967-C5)-methyltransferase
MSRVAPGRRAAYLALRAVNSGRADLPDAMARVRDQVVEPRDQALAAALAAGTLRWMGALDAVIAAFVGRPVSRLDPEVLDALRLGAFQLLHMDRIPARAAIDDGVELVREQRKSSASGLVNAVLRRIDRERDHLPLPARPADAANVADGTTAEALDYLSVALSHPRWLTERWLAARGFSETEAWLRFDNTPAPVTLRVNTLRASRGDLVERLEQAAVRVEPTRFAPEGLVVLEGHPLSTPLFDEGLFFVQDEASQLVAEAAGARPGDRVLDACASPGGKTLAMACAMRGEGRIVAGDLRGRRVDLLSQTIARAAATSIHIVRLDAEAIPFGPVFDLVLLDAPCSGLGTIRRDPEIRWRRTVSDLPVLSAVQSRMIERAAAGVKPGGRLVYATCSSEPEENELVVEAFLAVHPEFGVRRGDSGPLPEGLFSPAGYLRTSPSAHGLEAFFAAVLHRRP